MMQETKTIRKWFRILGFEKEEDWLNEMACATLMMYALGRIHGKKEALERARILNDWAGKQSFAVWQLFDSQRHQNSVGMTGKTAGKCNFSCKMAETAEM